MSLLVSLHLLLKGCVGVVDVASILILGVSVLLGLGLLLPKPLFFQEPLRPREVMIVS